MPRRLCRFLCILFAIAAGGAAAQSPTPVIDLIASYADWAHGRRDRVDLIAIDLDVVRQELGRIKPASLPVPANLPAAVAREHQRRLLVTFALELAAVGSKKHAAAAARLGEMGSPPGRRPP